MSLMLGGMAVTEVAKYLNGAIKPNGALASFKGKVYKYERTDETKGEYIAVNHLPFVHRDAVGEGTVNINIHVPETKTHQPDTKRLDQLAEAVASMFPEDTYLGKAYFEFYADSRPTPDSDKTYYVNIQLNVLFNNLNS